ncbi:unnamed protein product [Gongylonema pulchrum]|uniref:Papilin n=1 Tax=Gongylonema pulchrum TaxID=637853 RepID=A0A183CYF2_9BILA|nr:unnamed protein product [Gongylonema pulchrum]
MEMNRGNCELGHTKWYYNMDAGECHVFLYTGCGGNGNRFSSKAECEHLCTSEIRFYTDSEAQNICELERDSGPCTDPVTQWYFDAHSRQCMQFTYGGCRGNENRFNSKILCERRCLMSNETSAVTERMKESCLLPFETGPCGDTQQLWYFDRSSQYCRLFVYGGCGGNENRFFSEDECMSFCSTRESRKFAEDVRPNLLLIGYNPAPVGSTVRMSCKGKRQQQPIRWHKNGVRMEFLKGNNRIVQSRDHTEIVITSTHESDIGEYLCSVGKAAVLSNPINLRIKEAEMVGTCVDRGNEMACKLVIRAGLCANPRYGNFCCRSCAMYQMSRKFS